MKDKLNPKKMEDYCLKTGKVVAVNKIHSKCPLPDYKDEEE